MIHTDLKLGEMQQLRLLPVGTLMPASLVAIPLPYIIRLSAGILYRYDALVRRLIIIFLDLCLLCKRLWVSVMN